MYGNIVSMSKMHKSHFPQCDVSRIAGLSGDQSTDHGQPESRKSLHLKFCFSVLIKCTFASKFLTELIKINSLFHFKSHLKEYMHIIALYEQSKHFSPLQIHSDMHKSGQQIKVVITFKPRKVKDCMAGSNWSLLNREQQCRQTA